MWKHLGSANVQSLALDGALLKGYWIMKALLLLVDTFIAGLIITNRLFRTLDSVGGHGHWSYGFGGLILSLAPCSDSLVLRPRCEQLCSTTTPIPWYSELTGNNWRESKQSVAEMAKSQIKNKPGPTIAQMLSQW